MTVALVVLYLSYGLYSFWPLIHKYGMYDNRTKWYEWALAWLIWCVCWPYGYIQNLVYWWRAKK